MTLSQTALTDVDEDILAGVQHASLLHPQHQVPHRVPTRTHHRDAETHTEHTEVLYQNRSTYISRGIEERKKVPVVELWHPVPQHQGGRVVLVVSHIQLDFCQGHNLGQ